MGVALCEDSFGPRKGPDPRGQHDAQGDVLFMQSARRSAFVAARGFHNEVRFLPALALGCAQEFDDAGVALCVILQRVGSPAEAELECGLGNVQASVPDGGIVLTHSCSNASPARCIRARSFNGSSSDQWMDDPHASRRGSPLQVPASAFRDLVHHPRAGCSLRGGRAFSQKRTLFSIQAAFVWSLCEESPAAKGLAGYSALAFPGITRRAA